MKIYYKSNKKIIIKIYFGPLREYSLNILSVALVIWQRVYKPLRHLKKGTYILKCYYNNRYNNVVLIAIVVMSNVQYGKV